MLDTIILATYPGRLAITALHAEQRGQGASHNLSREVLPERKLEAQFALVFHHFYSGQGGLSNKGRKDNGLGCGL